MKKIILTLIVLAIVGGGSYAYYVRKGTIEPTITTMPLTRGDIAEVVQANGTLEPVEKVDVGTQVSGIVMELLADYNHIVKKGQVIARLDPSLIEVALERAEANVVRAKAELERLEVSLADAERKLQQAQAMWEKQLIPRDQLETAELNVKSLKSQIVSSKAGLAQAEAEVNTQKVNLGHTIIRAPIDGVVISRNVDQGQTVAASMNAPVLYQLAEDLTRMQVLANIDEAEIGKLRKGQEVEFTVDAYPTDRFRGRVEEIRLSPTTVQNVVTYSVVISAPNPQYKLKPGMTANVTIEIARRQNVLRAPAAALRFRPTPDMFMALKQEIPADLNRGFGGRGGGRGRGDAGGRAGFNGASGQPGEAPQGDQAAGAERPGGGTAGGDRPAGVGGGRGNANLTPEQREARRREMMANMSPEERERWEARMREGGQSGGRGNRGGTRAQESPAPATQSASRGTAVTIDELFLPLRTTESPGRLWLVSDNKQLRAVNVRTGISDGTWVEIIEGAEASELQPGVEVVTNIVTGLEQAQRSNQGTGNPLMQQPGRGGFGGPGGGRGPGGGGGRGR